MKEKIVFGKSAAKGGHIEKSESVVGSLLCNKAGQGKEKGN